MLPTNQLTVYDTLALADYQVLDLLLEQDGRSLSALAASLPGPAKDPRRRAERAVTRLLERGIVFDRSDDTVWLESRALAREVSERWHLRRGLCRLSQGLRKPRLRQSALAASV